MTLPVKQMRAAILAEIDAPLIVDEVELPESLAPGQVLVRVHFSGVCGSQVGEVAGAKGPDRYLPHLLGHEGGGVVLEVGPGVRTVSAGDHVVLHWRPGSGIEAAPPIYRWRGEQLNAGWVTTFNDHAVVSENRVTVIPTHLSLDSASLFGCPVTTGLGVVDRDARLRLGESIVVIGAGGVGLSVVQGAALSGALPIVAIDLTEAKRSLALELGATHALDGRDPDLESKIRAIVGAAGADVVVENTGRPPLIRLAYELSKAQGRTVLVGVPPKGEETTLYTLPVHFGKVLTGSHGGSADPERDLPRWLALADAGKLRLEPMITDRYDLDGINDALAGLRNGAVAGRAVVDMGHGGTPA